MSCDISEVNSVPMIQIRFDSIIVYNHSLGRNPRSLDQLLNEKNLTRGEFNGYMSPKTKSKVKKLLSFWILGVRRYNRDIKKAIDTDNLYISFFTATLSKPQVHDDNFIKRNMFGRFLEDCKKHYGVKFWFWRAEAQENGRIHFHVLFDKFIDKDHIGNLWDEYQNKYGYMDKKYWDEENNRWKSPSTKIHKLENCTDLMSYLLKYVCKVPKEEEIDSSKYRKVQGRIWGCSDELRLISPYIDHIDSRFDLLIEKMDLDQKIKKEVDENFTIYRCDSQKVLARYNMELLREFNGFVKNQIIDLYKMDLEKIDISELVKASQPPPKIKYVQEKIPF